MTDEVDDRLLDLFRAAGGVLCRRDAPALARRFSRLTLAGLLWSPLPGVFGLNELRGLPEARILAGVRWIGPDAVVCGWAAARLGFWPGVRVPVVELATRHAARRPRTGWAVTRRRVPLEWIRERSGVRYTAPALTAVDLAADPHAGEVIDQALRVGAATLDEMWSALRTTANRRGNQNRALLLHDSRDRPWSEAEREAHRLLRRSGITGWVTNAAVPSTRFYADILFEQAKVIVEIDGWETHGTRPGFESDRRRRNMLVLAGYRVLNFTWRQLVDDPEWVVACITQALS